MRVWIFLILIFKITFGFSQTWVAGDSVNYVVDSIETNYDSDATVGFDIDCDGLSDVNISSHSTQFRYDWPRLSFYMVDSVEVYNSNTGLVSIFSTGETVRLIGDSLWTENLDFIYGIGQAGSYGQSIDEKYIIFRKKNESDIKYIFMSFSNTRVNFSIHHIISKCSDSLLEVISDIGDNGKEQALTFYPNPVSNVISFNEEIEEVKLISVNGAVMLDLKSVVRSVDVSYLESGVYFLIVTRNGLKQTYKVLKE